MCKDCGCGLTGHEHHAETIDVMRDLMADNDRMARHNREHFDSHGVMVVNLMSSPGAGKTRLLEATVDSLAGWLSIAVIEGDLETENDAARLRAKGVPAYQITTGGACHLDAAMVHDALHHMDLDGIDLLFVENVGNLVCPAGFDLGQHLNAVLLSVTEGDDKPAKYPVMFRAADLVVLSKCDLLQAIPEFDPDRARHALSDLGLAVPVIETAGNAPAALEAWLDWLDHALDVHRARLGLHDIGNSIRLLAEGV